MFFASQVNQICNRKSLIEQLSFVQPKIAFFNNTLTMNRRDSPQLLLFGCGTCPVQKGTGTPLVSGYETGMSLPVQ